jgi:hypothetical protein
MSEPVADLVPASPNQVAYLLCCAAAHMRSCCMVGNPAPAVRAFYERIRDPRPGDWVMETTTLGGAPREVVGLRPIPADDYTRRVGRLKTVCREPYPSWDEEREGEPAPTEEVFYVESLAGELVRWVNASFVAIPTDPYEVSPPDRRKQSCPLNESPESEATPRPI